CPLGVSRALFSTRGSPCIRMRNPPSGVSTSRHSVRAHAATSAAMTATNVNTRVVLRDMLHRLEALLFEGTFVIYHTLLEVTSDAPTRPGFRPTSGTRSRCDRRRRRAERRA